MVIFENKDHVKVLQMKLHTFKMYQLNILKGDNKWRLLTEYIHNQLQDVTRGAKHNKRDNVYLQDTPFLQMSTQILTSICNESNSHLNEMWLTGSHTFMEISTSTGVREWK
jgi:hypothetical protein